MHHSINGSFAIRQGDWKLELCPGSGGWSPPRPGRDDEKGCRRSSSTTLQRIARAEQRAGRHPEVVARLTKLLKKYVADGRSTPGTPTR